MAPRSLHVAAAALLGAALLSVAPDAGAADKLPAVDPPYHGLDDKEQVLEFQAWWTEFGHVHGAMVMSVPVGGRVSGELIIDVRAALHNNPSTLESVEIRMRSGTDDDPVALASRKDLALTCPYSGTGSRECSYSWTFRISTDKYPDGVKQMILHINTITPDKKEYFTSSRVPVEFDNGNRSDGDSRPDNNTATSVGCVENSALGRAWYDVAGGKYSDAHALCMPKGPVSGIWRQKFAGDDDTSHLTITLSATHEIEEAGGKWPGQEARIGKIIFDKKGSFKRAFTLPIDTRLLENGVHSLAIRTTRPETAISVCEYCQGIESALSGVAKYWFEVRNP